MKKHWWWLALPLVLIGLLSCKPISLATADLGRHLTNGRLILAEGLRSSVLSTNRYSYTHSEFPVLNHHWLFGVLSYGVFELSGWTGLSLLVTVTVVAAGGLSFAAGRTQASFGSAWLALLLFVPLITDRTEVRPELVSLVFFALFLWLLLRYQAKRLSFRWLLLLLPLQLIWVNTHVFFVLGLAAVAAFTLFATSAQRKPLLLLTLGLTLASLLNPFGWRGLVEPLMIFHTYEYPVAENQSLWFMLVRSSEASYWYFSLVLTLNAGLVLKAVWHLRQNPSSQLSLERGGLYALAGVLTLGGMFMIRLIPFASIALVPVLAVLLKPKRWLSWLRQRLDQTWVWSLGLPLVIIVAIPLLTSGLFLPRPSQFGYGLPNSTNQTVAFLRAHAAGPMFNNYDIGGMLIYTLYPTLPVYTDNRPEAYPAGFFSHDYSDAQENTARWQELLDQYDFQSIIFYWHDATTWAQPFLIERLAEDEWQPVYIDQDVLFLARNSAQNQALLEQFTLPKSMFSGVKQ